MHGEMILELCGKATTWQWLVAGDLSFANRYSGPIVALTQAVDYQ
jgi:hypothetical protein